MKTLLALFLFLVFTQAGKSQNVFPPLKWDKIIIDIKGQRFYPSKESEFIDLTRRHDEFMVIRGDNQKMFKCCVDAAFWVFKNELTTSSHFGDRALKEFYREKIRLWEATH